ncbi:MAG: alpha/beta hydrolase [Gammaproteobacteria bacterium]|nr:alpha/beta hydrolase [Gammaproteobacteria bacterium]
MPEIVPVCFRNGEGQQLVGMLHLPAVPVAGRPCILLLSPGVKMRVAPHRMYNKMAEAFVREGFAVLRFDFSGLGDAEGEIKHTQLSHIYNSIQLGCYIDDTRAALDWLQAEHGFSRCIAGGLCGGALTGLLTAEHDQRIVGLLALGIPVALDVGDAQWSAHLTRGQLDQLRQGYLSKLRDPASWLRLLSFKSDYRVIWKSIKRLFERNAPKPVAPTPNGQPTDNTNPRFAPAFFAMSQSRRPMLHIFSGSDRLAAEFKEKFQERDPERLAKHRDWVDIHVIDKANHILAHPDWFNEMLSVSCVWLRRFQ